MAVDPPPPPRNPPPLTDFFLGLCNFLTCLSLNLLSISARGEAQWHIGMSSALGSEVTKVTKVKLLMTVFVSGCYA